VSELVRNRPSPEGEALGREMARLCDTAEPEARLKEPSLPPRCASCAFRHGRHLANRSAATQMDAVKCLIEGVEFQCHEPARKGQPCSGWAMMMLAGERTELGSAPWPFSDDEAAA